MIYGLPYQGSKNSIAEWVIYNLPSGKRFVDLFGGGFAISHYAILSHKYKPKFIDKQTFDKLKNKDGYIKYIWSFANNGIDYMYGKNIVQIKKKAHNQLIFNNNKNDNVTLEHIQRLWRGV